MQSAARRAGLDWANAEGRRRIVVASTDAPRAAASAGRAARAHGRGGVLAYARSINPGEVVAASDLVWSDEAVAPADAPADADAVIGKAARRPLREGAAVGAHDLASAKVIARGDAVDVAFEDNGITLVLQAKAQADAAVGDSLTLVNTASHKTLEAVASGPGKAVVGPAAEALRSAAMSGLALAAR
ncbi:MAG: flagellar basal body P-ring formation protein FlgA [Caulobacteraceae bacterium]|nr:flagellar basal body P-ring formation protein FlgA [Caulobacter sp.]